MRGPRRMAVDVFAGRSVAPWSAGGAGLPDAGKPGRFG